MAIPGGPASVLEVAAAPGREGRTPVLLLHGFAGDVLTWQFTVTPLAGDRPVIAVDLPGHGQSTPDVGDGRVAGFAPWLEQVLDALDVPRVHVVGHSMGGAVALALARTAPGRVAALSLIAPAGLSPDFDRELLRRLPCLRTPAEADACAARLFAGPSPLAAGVARVLLANAVRPERRAALERIIDASFRTDPEPLERTAAVAPVQVLWGRCDGVIPLPPADRLPPGARLHVFEDAGHMLHGECPGPVGAAVRAFLAGAEGRAGEEEPWSRR
ncbi:alpha/beta fold hydrolase [Azospirillum halopraeferens]|uniref:alpha/beta fold hydrolase n=1 Tax=Azospirillum halopraeferens TaxID=34010 RepID=UPI00041C5567|nr:alpha/beta fold hydrolase [Azospirillum halopraeferens]